MFLHSDEHWRLKNHKRDFKMKKVWQQEESQLTKVEEAAAAGQPGGGRGSNPQLLEPPPTVYRLRTNSHLTNNIIGVCWSEDGFV